MLLIFYVVFFVFVLCLVYPILSMFLDCMSSSCVLYTQCCRCLWIVGLRPVSCILNVVDVSGLYVFVDVSGLYVFVLCLVYNVVLYTQCCRCLWIVCLRPVYPMLSMSLVSCVPNVVDVSGLYVFVLCLVYPMLSMSSGLYVFVLCLVYPMLSMSLDCMSSSCVLCTQCCRCFWIVCLRPVSCIPNVVDVSGLYVFVLYLVYPMLSMSLDCMSSSCVLCTQCCRCFCVPNVVDDCMSSSCVLCTQCCRCLWIVCLRSVSCVPNVVDVSGLYCCRCLWIVCLRPVSCVPNVVDVSGLYVFVLCLVYPMLSMSLDCMSSSCVLCTQCCRSLWIVCLWIVCLRPVSCVPNVVDVSGLYVFVLCLVYSMLSMSLDCMSSSCVLYTQCCRCLWIVCLRPVSCVPNVVDGSGLYVFVLCLLYPMLSMFLDCMSSSCVLYTQCGRCFWIVCLRPVSCIPNVVDVSGLHVFVLCLVYSMWSMSLDCMSSSCVLYTQCCRCLWIVCLRPVSCVPNVFDGSGLYVFVLCLVYPMLSMFLDCMSSSCVLYTQCGRCFWIVCLRPVSCIPNVVDVSGLYVFVLCLVYPMLSMFLDCMSSSCVLCTQCCRCLWSVCVRPVSCVPNVVDISGLYVTIRSVSCVLQCCRCLWFVCLRPVYCVPNVVDVSGLYVFVLCLVYPMLSMFLDCMSSSCVLYTPMLVDVSGLYVFVMYLVYPML